MSKNWLSGNLWNRHSSLSMSLQTSLCFSPSLSFTEFSGVRKEWGEGWWSWRCLVDPTWTTALIFPASLLQVGCPWDPLLANEKWYFSCHICHKNIAFMRKSWQESGNRSVQTSSSLKTFFITFFPSGRLVIIINVPATPY